jgi:hypothetical protein
LVSDIVVTKPPCACLPALRLNPRPSSFPRMPTRMSRKSARHAHTARIALWPRRRCGRGAYQAPGSALCTRHSAGRGNAHRAEPGFRSAHPGYSVAQRSRARRRPQRRLHEINGLREWFAQGVPAYLDAASQVLAVQMRTEGVEGVAASSGKRPPRWALPS